MSFREIHPMLAGSRDAEELDALWGDKDWVCEEKIDGSRYILQFDYRGVPKLTSRKISVKTGKPVDKTENLMGYMYTDVVGPMAGTILDGEIVADGGFAATVSVMGSTPRRAHKLLDEGKVKLKYVVYDILALNGVDLRGRTFQERRQYLLGVLAMMRDYPFRWQLVPILPNDRRSYETVLFMQGEGVILKHKDGVYEEGKRSKDWVKVKKTESAEGIILGMAPGEGKYAKTLGALKIGQWKNGRLMEVATASGMTDELRNAMWDNSGKFIGEVVEFLYQEKTDGRYRHPRFLRMRPDKDPKDCTY